MPETLSPLRYTVYAVFFMEDLWLFMFGLVFKHKKKDKYWSGAIKVGWTNAEGPEI